MSRTVKKKATKPIPRVKPASKAKPKAQPKAKKKPLDPPPKLKHNYKSDLFIAMQKRRKNKLLVALQKSFGVVNTACKMVGITRKTFYVYYHADLEFKARADDTQEVALDSAETQLHKNIRSGKEASLIFYLKTRGKRRGFIEKGDDSAMVVNITSSTETSPEELL